MKRLRVKAHAKINPLLSVARLRPDGFHDIRTVFQAVSLHDTVVIEEADSFSLECTIPSLSGEANLAWKAVRLLAEQLGMPKVTIRIEKSIPIQAGLGGGSSDAAAVIRGLNAWHGEALSQEDVLAVASACGSDASFFALGVPRASASGRGQVLLPEPAGLPETLLIAKPSHGCSTPEMYAALDAFGARPSLENDFELVAPEASLALMKRLGEDAHLCGSGSAVYRVFTDAAEARRIAEEWRSEGVWAEVCETLQSIEGPEWIS